MPQLSPQPPESAKADVWPGYQWVHFLLEQPLRPQAAMWGALNMPQATPWVELVTLPHWENVKVVQIFLFWVTLKMYCPAARIGLQPAHPLCGLCRDLWCPLTNNFLAVKFLRFVNNEADKRTAITQHLHGVLKQGYLILKERRRMSAHHSSGEWSTFCVNKEKKNLPVN